MNRPQVAYFLSGVLVYFPSGVPKDLGWPTCRESRCRVHNTQDEQTSLKSSTTTLARKALVPMRLGFILGVVALAGAASLRVRAQEIDVYVNSPRPLAEAVKEFERRCKCVITYEDLKWRSDQVEPSPIFRRRSDGAAAMIPRGIPFTFTVPQDLAQMSPAVIGQHFDSVLGSFEAIQNPGEFKVVRGERSIHVIPAASAILNRPICVIADGVPAI